MISAPNRVLTEADQAMHAVHAHLHLYGRDLNLLIGQLSATQLKSSWIELYSGQGLHLAPERVVHHLTNVAAGLDNLPLHFLVDDGVFQAPYKNVAFRAEAGWHRDALRDLAERLLAATHSDDG